MVNINSLTRSTIFSVALLVCLLALMASSAAAAPSRLFESSSSNGYTRLRSETTADADSLKSSNSKGYTRLPHQMTLRDYLKVPSGKGLWSQLRK
ncbi:hypothetical protein NDA16_001144 [Ustilago loliicola]|nr:hypothetical protein NDA16_001144 [Ustilago loliicola]